MHTHYHKTPLHSSIHTLLKPYKPFLIVIILLSPSGDGKKTFAFFRRIVGNQEAEALVYYFYLVTPALARRMFHLVKYLLFY